MTVELWRKAWREGFAPQLSDECLAALVRALESDSPELIQGATTSPPPLACSQDWPVEAACAITLAGWKGLDLQTVQEAEEFFANRCFAADERLGEPAGCRWFINWFDETPREKMRPELLAEVQHTLRERETSHG